MMKQLVFIDKGKDGKDRIFTTSKTGKILFPHKNLKIEFEPITVIDDFKVEYEKENYGFFTGKKVDICLPEPKDLVDSLDKIVEALSICMNPKLWVAGSFYMIETASSNILITQEVDSGEIVMISENCYSESTRSRKNPHYYSIYNGMTALGKRYLDFDKCVAGIHLLRDIHLSKAQKAALALHANCVSVLDKRDGVLFTYYNKCIIKQYKKHDWFSLYYVDLSSKVACITIDHDTLFSLVANSIIESANPNDYKDAVDECFEEGFSIISSYSPAVEKVYERIVGKTPENDDLFGYVRDYCGEQKIFAMNIDKYDDIKKLFTEDQIKQFAKITKDSIQGIDSTIKQLGKCATKEAINRITKMNYKRIVTITV